MSEGKSTVKKELNVYEERFFKLMRLIKIQRMMSQGQVVHKQIPKNGSV